MLITFNIIKEDQTLVTVLKSSQRHFTSHLGRMKERIQVQLWKSCLWSPSLNTDLGAL